VNWWIDGVGVFNNDFDKTALIRSIHLRHQEIWDNSKTTQFLIEIFVIHGSIFNILKLEFCGHCDHYKNEHVQMSV
jgi:hypothetical protein